MSSHGAFEQAWLSFAGSVLRSLGPRELAAARLVFYAGGAAAFDYLTVHAAGMDEDAGCQAIEDVRQELVSFIAGSGGPTQ